MSMIFPGMDPYLENPHVWPNVHASFIIYLRDQLRPLLRPRYLTTVEERVYVEGPEREVVADVAIRRPNRPAFSRQGTAVAEAATPVIVRIPPLEVHEALITILDRDTGRQIVTVIEMVSPTNKYAGPGRDSYLTKQRQVLGSGTHLVEIDLLRYGPHVLSVPEFAARNREPYDYLVCTNRAEGIREEYALHLISLRQRLPRIRIPLADKDADVVVDLQTVLARVYEEGGFIDLVNYDNPCVPPLRSEDQQWANECIRQAATQQHPPSA